MLDPSLTTDSIQLRNLTSSSDSNKYGEGRYISISRCKADCITYSLYVGHLESKERLRIQPAQLFNLLATDFFFQILAHPVFKM